MSELILTTADSVYTYSLAASEGDPTAQISFEYDSNIKTADTQGFLRKVQKGRYRIRATVTIMDTKSRIEANVLPMWQYPQSVNVTFDRNIPGKSTATGEFVMEAYKILQEFDAGAMQEVELQFTEVLYQ